MRSHTAISLVLSASLTLVGGGAPAAASVRPGGGELLINVGQADGLTHIEFNGLQPRNVRRDGADVVLQFPDAPDPDLSLLKITPPRFLKTAALRRTGGGLELRLTLQTDAAAKVGRADGGAYVNLGPDPRAQSAGPAPADQTPQRGAGPVAAGGVKLVPTLQDGLLRLKFAWAAPLGAAVFRRGDAIWMVFDTKADMDLSLAPHGLPQAKTIEQVPDDDATVLRITTAEGVVPSVSVQGGVWTLALAATPPPPMPAIELKPELAATPVGLSAKVAGATGVFWLKDPVVGDRLAAVTALGPPKGVPLAHGLVDAEVLASAQGLALAPRVSDLTVVADSDVVHIGRPGGMALSSPPSGAHWAGRAAPGLPQSAAMPALIDFAHWSALGEGGFMARYQALQQGAFDEMAQGAGAGVQARFAFARFLIGSELAFEALGVLDRIAKADPVAVNTAEFRGLRGASRAMAGRYKDAQADFSSPTLIDDPASALWRGYVAAKLGDDAGARSALAAGRSALAAFNPRWRARFDLAAAEADLGVGDTVGAGAQLAAALAEKPVDEDAQALALERGRLAEAKGQVDPALALYDQAAADDAYAGPAARGLLHATELRMTKGRISPDAATDALNSVRFRWRGDSTELEAVRALGRVYIAQGRYREALEAMLAAKSTSPDLAESASVQGDLGAAFRNLFLNGGADGLPPIQALALFTDFKDLTPIGADGDEMVRKLARRLVDVDLLDQAADLMKYQADNRLDGVARAQVDTNLATIQLMNRRPEAALDALNASRTTLLPAVLQEQRRVLEARALSDMGRYDDAMELVAGDPTPDGRAAVAEIAWAKHDWPLAGKMLEVALGGRWKSAAPLGATDQAQLLRCAIAYSLAGDDGSLNRLRTRYAKLADGASQPNALRVALAGVNTGPTGAADYASASSASDAFAGWVAAMKAKLMTAPGMG